MNLKKSIYWILLFINNSSVAQEGVKKPIVACDECELCREVISSKYNEDQKKVLLAAWNDYEGLDLERTFPSKSTKHVVSVKFDALGCIYPPFVNDENWKKLFYEVNFDRNDLRRFSFFGLMEKRPDVVKQLVPDYKELFTELQEITTTYNNRSAYFEFKEKWNRVFLQVLTNKINDSIRQNGLTHSLFFIPGFNVPYGLSHIQGNEVFSQIVEQLPAGVSSDKVLFVRVFWPSNNEKYSDFNDSSCNVNNIKKLKLGILFQFITNRAYLAGLSLREIIHSIDASVKINVLSHSFGACVAAASVLSPMSKISRKHWLSEFNWPMLNEFECKPIPDRPITFFLNAPGIPGVSTFANLDSQKHKKHVFFIGHNRKDEVATKKDVPIITPKYFNSISLGSNWDNEVSKTQAMFDKAGLHTNFIPCRTGEQENHDIFCYLKQPGFRELFKRFVAAAF